MSPEEIIRSDYEEYTPFKAGELQLQFAPGGLYPHCLQCQKVVDVCKIDFQTEKKRYYECTCHGHSGLFCLEEIPL